MEGITTPEATLASPWGLRGLVGAVRGVKLKEDRMTERATELEYLKWFVIHCDLGPAHGDVMDSMNRDFMRMTGMNLPVGWNLEQDGETNIDME